MSINIPAGFRVEQGQLSTIESGSGLRIFTRDDQGLAQTLWLQDKFGSGSKALRIISDAGGTLQVLNTAATAGIFQLADSGNLSLLNTAKGTGSFVLPRMPGKPLDT